MALSSKPVLVEVELSSMLVAGAVTPRSVRLLARGPEPGDYRIEIEAKRSSSRQSVPVRLNDAESDLTRAWSYPDDFDGATPLEPSTVYEARLIRQGEQLAQSVFQTPPADIGDAPDRWSFGAFSCHQPYTESGSAHEDGHRMVIAAKRAFSADNAAFLLMMGDQIYGDYPSSFSLFDRTYFERMRPNDAEGILDCSRAEIRAIYQQRYRQFWGVPDFCALQSQQATVPILDDHEIIDNFGSDHQHSEDGWQRLKQGALDAYYDYQAARLVRDRAAPFDHGFTWGPGAFYVLDVRSQRRTEDEKTQVFTSQQLERLSAFLSDHAHYPILTLVTSIPIVFAEPTIIRLATAFLSDGSDFHERWSHPRCVADRDRLLTLLHRHSRRNPEQIILLLGGDVHTGAAYALEFDDGTVFYQLISSAISNNESALKSAAAELGAHTAGWVNSEGLPPMKVRLLSGVEGQARNPFGGLNVGSVEVRRDERAWAIALRLISHDGDGEPTTVFRSSDLQAVGRQ